MPRSCSRERLLRTAAATAMLLATDAVQSRARLLAQNTPAPNHYLSIRIEDAKWEKLEPSWGADSPEIAILRVDPKTQATQLLIRHPKAMHIPPHWHTANETHTILKGTYIFECNGQRETLGPGSFNYLPAKMVHQAWAPDGGMFFITVDSAWDVNWVAGPPQRPPRR